MVLPHDPLIPARDEHDIGIEVNGSVPLLLDIVAGKQWRDVTPVFRSPRGLTLHRDWDGFGNCHYVNTSGRNDILEARIARDADTVFFRVTCAAPITPREGEGWMTLFLNTDRRQP